MASFAVLQASWWVSFEVWRSLEDFSFILCLFSANRAFVWRRSRREGHGHGATVQKTHRTGAFVTFAEMVWSRNIIYPKEKKKKTAENDGQRLQLGWNSCIWGKNPFEADLSLPATRVPQNPTHTCWSRTDSNIRCNQVGGSCRESRSNLCSRASSHRITFAETSMSKRR